MTITHKPSLWLISLLATVPLLLASGDCFMQTAHADAVNDGLDQIGSQVDVPTGSGQDVRGAVGSTLRFLVTFVSLAAIVTIIISGFILILGLGSEPSIQRTRKIFIYTLTGVLIIFFARVIVAFFTQELPAFF